MNIDLRGYRQKVGMDRVQVVNILRISHEEVCGYEEAPESVGWVRHENKICG